jgi:hypothetical protein
MIYWGACVRLLGRLILPSLYKPILQRVAVTMKASLCKEAFRKKGQGDMFL